jgi:hypothetical protein
VVSGSTFLDRLLSYSSESEQRGVGKQSRTNRRLSARAEPPRKVIASGRRTRLGIVAVVAGILIAGLAVGAIAFAAGLATFSSSGLPPGTQTFAELDHTHVSGPVTYDHVPPAGGAHNPVWLNCGVYTQPVPNENAVHSLEHGTVWITYQPSLPADQVAILQQLVTSNYVGTQRYLLLSPYAGIPSPIVASAWGAQLGVDLASDSRLADFIHHFAGGAQGHEPGAACTGGVGSPVD